MNSPESHELESFFEKLTQPPPEHTAHGQGDPAEEFNALFKKLSALDELNWAPEADHRTPAKAARTRATPEPAEETTAAASADAADPVAAEDALLPPQLTQEAAPQPAAKSAAMGATPAKVRAETASAQPVPAKPVARKADARPKSRAKTVATTVSADAVTTSTVPGPSMMDRAGRVLKIATVSLALFGIGLGAVWAALTLPQRVNQAQPTMAERAIPNGTRAAAPAQASQLPATAAELAVTEVEPKPAIPAAPAAMVKANKPGTQAAPVASTPAMPSHGMPQDSTAPRSMDQTEPVAAQTADTGGFALQVGACASEQCLANYRSLLTNFVTPDNIRVITASSDVGTTVQRVRIAPLDLEQARKLKLAMAADARLRNAYVITLN